MIEKDDKQESYRSEILTAFRIPKETFEGMVNSNYAALRESLDRHMTQHVCNISVSDKFGIDVDNYLNKTNPEYNNLTRVVIIADTDRQSMQYTYFESDKKDLSLVNRVKFKRIDFRRRNIPNSGTMIFAYAPEIDTLFVRTLFDVIPTPVDPNDKMDIEARLGL